MRLFELDVKEMFPRLDREEVVQGAEAVYEAVLQALRKIGPRGRGKRIASKGPIFAVHNKNKKICYKNKTNKYGRLQIGSFGLFNDVLFHVHFEHVVADHVLFLYSRRSAEYSVGGGGRTIPHSHGYSTASADLPTLGIERFRKLAH